MNISTFIKYLDLNSIVSEQDTRTKVADPILNMLGYPAENLANEFPIYGNAGRKVLNAKSIDILLFSDSGFENNRKREDRSWVMSHSLLGVELKKPSESLDDAQGQAQFYSHWCRSPYYMCTNGIEIAIYKLSATTSDEIICKCNIKDLASKWTEVYSALAYNNIKALKNSHKYDNNLIFEGYCESKIKKNYDSYWVWNQKIVKYRDDSSDTEDSIFDIKLLLSSNKLMILLAEAGFGKTTTILRLHNDLLQDYLNLQTNVIPIFLYAKYWKKTFNSIEEGILNELESFVGGINIDVVKSELLEKKFILFIDGLDECLESKEVLLQNINKLATIDGIKIVTSSRSEKYHNELTQFECFKLKELSDSDMTAISTDILNQPATGLIYSMSTNLRDTLRIPLFFSMWLNYCLESGKPTIPQNQATLYEHFITRSIIDGSITKGNYDSDLLPINLLKDVLSQFAYSDILEKSNTTLFEIMINTPFIKEKIESSLTVLYQSGLIFNFDGVIDFRQYSMKEYFCAFEISRKTRNEVLEFIEINHNRIDFKEIIFHLLGIVNDEIIQEDILNFLEKNNLALYVQCLKRRFNFSNQQYAMIDKAIAKKFLKRISQSYEAILDNYFPVLKERFAPWQTMDKATNRIFLLKGNLDLISLDLSISLNSGYRKQGSIDFTFKESKPSVFVERDGKKIPIPIKSFTNGYDKFYYNINEMYEGFDCSREIAIDMIKSGLKHILESKQLLFDEPPYMQLAYVEESLKYLPMGFKDSETGRRRQLSLAIHSADELLNFFMNTPNLVQYRTRDDKYNALVTAGVLSGLNGLEMDSNRILSPKRDRPFIGSSGHVSELYTTESIKSWANYYIAEKQNSYRLFIETFFNKLKIYIPEYISGPFRYDVVLYEVDIMQNKFNEHAGISIYPFPVKTESIRVNVRVIAGKENDSEYEVRAQIVNEQYKHLGRPNGYYTESNSDLWYEIRDENNIRKRVYDKAMKNVISILDGK